MAPTTGETVVNVTIASSPQEPAARFAKEDAIGLGSSMIGGAFLGASLGGFIGAVIGLIAGILFSLLMTKSRSTETL
jgi:outer membrane lipoprotein SlyB